MGHSLALRIPKTIAEHIKVKADAQNNRVAEYSGGGTFLTSFVDGQMGRSFYPTDVLVDGSGDVYAVGGYNSAGVVVKFNSIGFVLGYFGIGVLNSPNGITTDGAGTFYVSEDSPWQIVVFH